MPSTVLEKIFFSGLPPWFKQELPDVKKMREMKNLLRDSQLHTVCEAARCPNTAKCWGQGVATFMILGDVCTRACRFCAVSSGRPLAVNPDEPSRVALTVKKLNLSYVVVTSVTRDDLADGGAEQFSRTVMAIRELMPATKIEVLIPDFNGEVASLEKVVQAGPDVVGHNIETVNRLFTEVRPQAAYQRSLAVLKTVKQRDSSLIVKSGFMVGLGENDDEILETMQALRAAGCDLLTIGQYLAPAGSSRHWAVQRFVTPEKFGEYERWGRGMGFASVLSGPLVRSSYLAENVYNKFMDRGV